MKEVLLL